MAAGGGWWRGPPEQTQCETRAARSSQIYDSSPLFSHTEAPLWSFWMYWTLSITFCHLCLPSLLPVPHSSSSFFNNISFFSLPLFLYLVSLSLFIPLLCSQTSWPAVHPDRVSTAVCAKLSCSSRGRLCSLRRRTLSQHLSLLSRQHPWPKHDLDTTATAKPPTHTGSPEEITQQKMHWIDSLKNILHTKAIK